MTSQEHEGLARLHADMVEDALPPAELLARYAEDPNGLSPEERSRVEEAMRRSPVVVDELDTLRGFDFGTLNADLKEERGAEGAISRILGALRGRPQLWAAAAAVALLVWLALPRLSDGPGTSPESTPRIAEQPAPPMPSEEREPAPLPERQGPAPAPEEPLLAEVPEAVEGPPAAPEAAPKPAPRQVAQQPEPKTESPAEPEAMPAMEPEPPLPETAQDEMLLAMAMPSYRPAYGTGLPGLSSWTTRSTEPDGVKITLASPDHVVRTSSARPPLYFLLDAVPEAGTFYLTIVDADDEPIVLDRALAAPEHSGLQRIDLAMLGVSLPEDRALRWSVALRIDEDAPPSTFDFGWIKVAPLGGVSALDARPIQDRIALYAEAGCFHEALDSALQTRARYPDDPRAERAVRSLLAQAGLEAPAP